MNHSAMKNSIRIFVLILVVVFGFVLSPQAATPAKQHVSFIIAETSDVHGSLFPWDFIEDKKAPTSLAQVQSWLKEKKQSGSDVILVDNGDILQGQPTVYHSNFEPIRGKHLAAKVMNYMKYSSATVGNHDIEAGHAVYDKIVSEFDFPLLAANAVNLKTGEPYFKAYTVINREGIKIAILGLITPSIPNWLPENIWAGMRFDDMVETAEKWLPVIRKKENPDLMVGMFHSGADHTYGGGTAKTYKNENASQLVALNVPGFDIVFVGHDHKGWNTRLENGVLLLGTVDAAKTIAVANIRLDWDTQKAAWKKSIQGEVIDVAKLEPDQEFMQTFANDIETIRNYVSGPVGKLTRTISTRDAMFGDAPFVDLIHRIQLEITAADISFAAPLSFDKTIEAGELYTRDMFKLYKYENLLYTMRLTGQEIKNFLEYSYGNWFNTMKDENDHLIHFKRDGEGNLIRTARTGSLETEARYYNYDSAAGIRYTVDISKPAGQRITIASMEDGSAFHPAKEYKVAINSYRGNGGGGHLTMGAGIPKGKITDRMLSSTIKDLRYYLMKWIEEKKSVDPQAFGNWEVIPTTWWQKGRQLDYALLYPKY
jgi:2',3'-cyclic-nucleotide 2'-phosphodiesterase/3'-nucleotidase